MPNEAEPCGIPGSCSRCRRLFRVPWENEVWLRVEHQALVMLSRSGGILFGIRVVNHPLADLLADSVARLRLVRALETIPEAMAVYKGIGTAREHLLERLRNATG